MTFLLCGRNQTFIMSINLPASAGPLERGFLILAACFILPATSLIVGYRVGELVVETTNQSTLSPDSGFGNRGSESGIETPTPTER